MACGRTRTDIVSVRVAVTAILFLLRERFFATGLESYTKILGFKEGKEKSDASNARAKKSLEKKNKK